MNTVQCTIRNSGRRQYRCATAIGIVLGLVLLLSLPAALAAGSLLASFWTTNNNVNASVLDGTTLYLAGDFTYVGPYTGSAALLDTSTAAHDSGFPAVNGTINAVISDGAGGWYIGGNFTSVAGSARTYLAHIKSDKTLDTSFAPVITGFQAAVNALHLQGSTLYVGGKFSSVAGSGRNNVAAIDTSTQTVTGWNPNANNVVYALTASGSTVYLGGQFTTIGVSTRTYIAAVSSATGVVTAWNPAASGIVRALYLNGALYVGGQFTTIGAQPRNRLAAIDTGTGAATAWNPNISGTVFAITQLGGMLYIGGQFTTVNGSIARNGIAALDSTTAVASAWDPNAGSGSVRCLQATGSVIYAGGNFSTIGGQARNRLAALDIGSGAAAAWDPSAGDTVNGIVLTGTTLLAGGNFNAMGGVNRNRLAAIDTATGQATAWDPNVNGSIYAMAVYGNRLYAGGGFTSVGGIGRTNLAAIDTSSGSVDAAWNPAPTSTVWSILADAGQVIVGGQFTSVGGQTRNAIARLAPANGSDNGAADPTWNINLSGGVVYTIAVEGARLFVGGAFSSVGGLLRNNIAALDLATGAVDAAWNPNANSDVYFIAPRGQYVYVGGYFTTMGGVTRNRLARVDASTASLDNSWGPSIGTVSDWVNAIKFIDDNVYVAGKFATVDGISQPYVAALDSINGNLLTWNPGALKEIWTLAVRENDVYMGANNTPANGNNWMFTAARFTPPVSLATPSGGAYNSAQTVNLTCTDSEGAACGATHYTTDGSTPTRASGLYATPLSINTNTTLKFFSRDAAGIDGATVTEEYVIDAMPPVTTQMPGGGVYASAQSVSLDCNDDNSGCIFTHYTTDGSAPSGSSPIYSGPIVIASNTTLRFFSRDNAGNAETSRSVSYMIDAVAPVTSASVAAGTYNSTQSITLSCSDDNSGCANLYYTSDGSNPTTASSQYTAPIVIVGNTTLRFFSVDNAGNSETPKTRSYVIDGTPPVTQSNYLAGSYTSLIDIVLSCLDDNSGCASTYFTLDGSVPSLTSMRYSDPFTLHMNTVLRFFTVDNADNSEAVNTYSYLINTPPSAADSTIATDEDAPAGGLLSANDTQNDPLTFSIADSPVRGSVLITDSFTGAFVYTPHPNAHGSDSFTFKASDGQAESNIAVVNITISAVNDPPTLLNNGLHGIIARVGKPVSINLGVQDADSADSHVFSALFTSSATTSASTGTVLVNGTQITFMPMLPGSDQLTLKVTDSGGLSGSLVIPVNVMQSNIVDSNSDGLSDAQARALGLNPYNTSGDSDDDGIVDALELGEPSNPTDTDGDGIIDALEIGSAASDNKKLDFRITEHMARRLGLPALRGERMSLSADQPLVTHNNGLWGIPVYAESQLQVPDPTYSFPLGLLDFSVAAPSGTATVTVQLPAGFELTETIVVRKRGNNGWQTLDNAVLDRAARTVTLHLIDNDALDLDATPGIIRDPVNIAEPARASGGGGCTLNPDAHYDPLFPLVYLFFALGLLGRHLRRA